MNTKVCTICGCTKDRSEFCEGHNTGNCLPCYRVYVACKAKIRRIVDPRASGYRNYGGRGLGLHKDWYDATVFAKWVVETLGYPKVDAFGRRQELGRINNDVGYFPGNIEYQTNGENGDRRRITVRVEYNGKEYTLRQLSELSPHRLNTSILWKRIFGYGWTVEQAVETPASKRRTVSTDAEIAAAILAGKKMAAVAKECHACSSRIAAIRRRLGGELSAAGEDLRNAVAKKFS